MNSELDYLLLEHIENGILQITLNRPTALNALNGELMAELYEVLLQAKSDNRVKALLLTGSGKAFCAGADIKQLADLTAHTGYEFSRYGQMVFRTLEQLGKPSVAAVNGFALGGGCELAMAATLRIAANVAVFGQPEIKLGVIPGFGGTQRLARLVGKSRALQLCLTGLTISAEVAGVWGLVNEVTTLEDLLSRSKQILTELTKLPAIAMASVMTVIDEGYDLPLPDAFQLEAAQFGLCCASADKQEGVRAFIEKRAATFQGE
ncbi:MAG: enoyl-CoA hydratase-related protein [Pseudomonadota bacterium]